MSEDGRFGGHSEIPASGKGASQDYGFFTSAAPAAAPSQFGGPPTAPPAQVRAPAPAPAAAPTHVALSPPPPAQTYPAAPVAAPWQLGAPPAYPQPPGYGPQPQYPPGKRGGLPVWAIIAICVPVAFVMVGILAAIAIPVFLNQRSTPVMPESIRGVARSTDPDLTQTAAQVREGVSRDNPGSKIDAAGYGSAQSGYVVIGANLRMNPAREFRSLGSTEEATSFGEIQCATGTASHISLCLRVGTRGSIEVLALGGSELQELAAETGKVWAAQPFGN